MEVTRSGYYSYLKKQKILSTEKDVKLIVELKVLHNKSNASYGSRRMMKALVGQGYSIGRSKVRRLMRENGIICKQRRRYVVTTNSKHNQPVAENILNRDFNAEVPNQKWVSDITYLWTAEGWLYIAAVLDLFSRRIVGWAIADHMQTNLIESAFKMAVKLRHPKPKLLLHSDQGCQYTSVQYQQAIKRFDVVVSMSRKGECWDNAAMERFFGSLKSEWTNGKRYKTKIEARFDVENFIDFYNSQRLHSTLDYVSPIAYEMLYKSTYAQVQKNGE